MNVLTIGEFMKKAIFVKFVMLLAVAFSAAVVLAVEPAAPKASSNGFSARKADARQTIIPVRPQKAAINSSVASKVSPEAAGSVTPSTPHQQSRPLTRQEIRNMPILERPNRPGHIYGNTVRRLHNRK